MSNFQTNGDRYPSYYLLRKAGLRLSVVTSALIETIDIREEGGKETAKGVYLRFNEDLPRLLVKSHKVVISSGVQSSTKLLMLSGVGPSEELRRHGIPTIVENESVGKNISDQFIISFIVYPSQGTVFDASLVEMMGSE